MHISPGYQEVQHCIKDQHDVDNGHCEAVVN